MSRRPTERECREIARRHKPRGWKVYEVEVPPETWTTLGLADFEAKAIRTLPLTDIDGLLVFLHECAHVNLQHVPDHALPGWQEEYEAEQYAYAAVRAAGFSVPRRTIQEGREYVQSLLPADTSDVSAQVLQFVYGKNWRDYS